MPTRWLPRQLPTQPPPAHDGPVSDFLVVYLDSIDERLLEHLDEDDELKLDALRHHRTA